MATVVPPIGATTVPLTATRAEGNPYTLILAKCGRGLGAGNPMTQKVTTRSWQVANTESAVQTASKHQAARVSMRDGGEWGSVSKLRGYP